MLQVLFVDADEGFRSSLLTSLPEMAHRVATFAGVANITAVRRCLRFETVDLIVTDLWGVSSDKDGIDVFYDIQAAAEGVPIVVLTAEDDEALRRRLLRHGARGYIVKGTIKSAQLFRTLMDYVHIEQTTVRLPSFELEIAKRAAEHISELRKPSGGDFAAIAKEERDAQALTLELGLLQLQKTSRLDSVVLGYNERLSSQKDSIDGLRAGILGRERYAGPDEVTSPNIQTQLTRARRKLYFAVRAAAVLSMVLCLLIAAIVTLF